MASVAKEETQVKDKAPTAQKLMEWLDVFGKGKKLPENIKKLFLEICVAYSLNPFKKEIHLIPFWNKKKKMYDYVPVIGYEVYLKRAERTERLDGWECHTEGEIILNDESYPERAIITIWRKDRSKPLVWPVLFKEVAQWKKDPNSGKEYLTSFWDSQPDFQLRKTAISQGMRLCFPDEMAGMAYEYPYNHDNGIEAEISMPTTKAAERVEEPSDGDAETVSGTVEDAPEEEAQGEQLELGGDGEEPDYFQLIVKWANGLKEASKAAPIMNKAVKAKDDQAALKEIYEKLEV